ncbi:MAG: nucleotidyltransferase family protein [Magnetococcales bacterium]|nr:nucleotidyltransferase family protein [Magnetococcales bacterium]
MQREEIMQLMAGQMDRLRRDFGVTRLALFGSTVRDEATADSDVDFLVAFDGPATSARYFGVQFFLEDLLGRRIDLVTEKALRPELRPYIEREAIHV